MVQSIPVSQLPIARRVALLSQLREAVKRDPKNAQLHLDIAGLLIGEKNVEGAIPHYKRALALQKRNPDILRKLVSAHFDLQQNREARKYARKLCQLEPRVAKNHKDLGLVLEYSGNPTGAIEAYERANRLEPGNAETLHDIGRCYGLNGKFDDARRNYEAALAADAGFAMAYYSLSTLKKFTQETAQPFVEQIISAIPATKEPSVLANLHYAAGKALQDAGQYDDAFSWFQKANNVRAPSNPPSISIPFQNSKDAFNSDYFSARGEVGLETNQPIFVFGMPRSGTTLVESLCGSHSQITAGDEQVFMGRIAKRLGRDSDIPGVYPETIHGLGRRDFRQMAEEYLELCKPVSGTTPHFTEKLPHNFMHLGLIAIMFPNAKLIHCRRHPLDNCFSLFSNSMQPAHNRYKTNLTRLGLYYRQYLDLMDHWRKHLPVKMHEVYYEDVVANTEFNARSMIDYLGLDWEADVMDRTNSQKSVRTLSGWQVRQPIYLTSLGKWRPYEEHLAPLIQALGDCVQSYEAELEQLESPSES